VSKNTNWKKLKKLKTDYKNERKGYRYRQYEILANTMAIVIELRSDESAVEGFLKLSGKKIEPTKAKKLEDWLTSAVVGYVTGAKSENAVKLAWKRARVLDHLHDDHAIPPGEIADAIQSRGGLEAVATSAAQENPRRSKTGGGTKNGGKTISSIKKNPFKSANAHKESTGNDADGAEDWDAPGDDDDPSGGEDSQIAVSISPDLRTKLHAIKVGRRVNLIGVRAEKADWVDVMLDVQEVRLLKR
jgi:hypothetical protein